MDKLIETDARGRATLPGHPTQRYLMQDQEDGSILLVPAIVLSRAQYEYDTNPQLRAMLDQAMSEPTIEGALPTRRTKAA